MNAPNRNRGLQARQSVRIAREEVNESDRPSRKLPEPTMCSGCKAVFQKGRWTWSKPPTDASHTLCPACRRIRDHRPAGLLTIGGPFFRTHRSELLNLARNQEAVENSEHPLCRIIEIKDEDDRILITTTDTHLPRRIGEALHSAYDGTLNRGTGDKRLSRVTWIR